MEAVRKYNIKIFDSSDNLIHEDNIIVRGVKKSRIRAIKILKSDYELKHGTIMFEHSIRATRLINKIQP